MLGFFRRLTKSKAGTVIGILFLVAILASFAIADITNFRQSGGSLPTGTLAKVGGTELTQADLDTALQRRLAQVREQNPQATYADLAGEFDSIVDSLIQERTLYAYAKKHGFVVSKKLIDAEIVKIPGVQGLDGRFSDAAYKQFLASNRLTDQQVRREIETALLQRLVLTPVAANARVAQGLARPYADSLFEQRSGEIALIPFAAFANGPAPTDAELQGFYRQNLTRYTIPERRALRIARITAEQLGSIAPSEKEIADYYTGNRALYGGTETRVLSRVTGPNQNAVAPIAARAKVGGTFAAAAAPAGYSAADVSLGPQTREQIVALAGEDVARAVFAAPVGTVLGPIPSKTGFDVIKVELIENKSGRTLEQSRAEIVAKLTADKKKEALADLVGKVEDELADGKTFEEVAAAHKLPVLATPPLTRTGAIFDQPDYKLPPEYGQLATQGFDLGVDDDPVVETLPNEAGYALLDVTDIVPATPAPLARIAAQVRTDFIARRANDQAAAAAQQVLSQVGRGTALKDAMAALKQPGIKPAEPIELKRGALAQFAQQGQEVPPPLRILFTLQPGKAQRAAGPSGIYLVKLDRIVPGSAASQPTVIAQQLVEVQRAAGTELALEWLNAAQKELKVSRNDKAIAEAKARILGTGAPAAE